MLSEGLAGLDNLRTIVVPGISESVLKSSWVDQIDSTTHQLSLQSCDLPGDANMQTLASALLAFLEVVGDSFEATAHLEKFLQEKSKTFLHTFGVHFTLSSTWKDTPSKKLLTILPNLFSQLLESSKRKKI